MAQENNNNSNSNGLTLDQELDLLKAEYLKHGEEIRMYIIQYSPKFTAFGVFVLSAFAFAFKNEKYEIIFSVIPFFISVICLVSISQTYIVTTLSGRIKKIERRIAFLNNGVPILTWESIVTPVFMFPPIVRGCLENEKKYWFINPLFTSVVCIVVAIAPLYFYSSYRGYYYINATFGSVAGYMFLATVSLLFGIMLIQAFSFFVFGQVSDEIILPNDLVVSVLNESSGSVSSHPTTTGATGPTESTATDGASDQTP